MKINYDHSLEYIVIDDFYNIRELELIWQEIKFLTPKLMAPEHTKSATENGQLLKKNTGIFLDDVYANRDTSNILSLNRKLWSPEIINEVEKVSPWWKLLATSNQDTTLLNYYQDQEYYKPHTDCAVITAITVLHSTPCNFTGGDFVFADYTVTIPCRSNSLIIFPSVVNHGVTPVNLIDKSLEFSGRYSIAQFMFLGRN